MLTEWLQHIEFKYPWVLGLLLLVLHQAMVHFDCY